MKFTKSLMMLMLTTVVLGGCGGPRGDASLLDNRIVPLPNRSAVALTADDVVIMMLRAGFSEEQILELGTDLRNALAANGSARLRVGEATEALFAVVDRVVHVSSRRRGSFIYDLDAQRCR
ncbi:MAG: hypothetical protein ACOC95_09565 [Planctomycetota bacterium]